MKSFQELFESVQNNLLTQTKFTDYSKIPLVKGSLIVCGYSYGNEYGSGDKEYICIGEYQGGNLNGGIYLTNEVVLSHISYSDVNTNKAPYIGDEDEVCADAVDFWRLPSTDEVKLYKKIIGQDINYFVEKFDKFIWEYTENEESVDYEQLFESLQEFVEMNKLKKQNPYNC